MAEDGAAEIEMVVDSVRVHMRTGRHVLVLRETGRGRLLMIWVGVNEANAIAMKLQGVTPERPLTHYLMVNVLEAMSIRVEKIVISDLAEETYHARIVLVGPDARHEVDSRPSDAIALAVRCEAQIFAADDVVEESSIEFQAGEDEVSLVTASNLSDLDPEEFRRFIETVTPEEFASSLEEALGDADEVDDDDEDEDDAA